jgi:predicted nucleic acid-binding Zn ribbon protein
MTERGPRLLSGAVERLRRQAAPPTLLAKVQACWIRAVGPAVSEQASPTSERAGVVTVSCGSAVWSSELSMLGDTLLTQLNEALPGDSKVRALKFTTRPSKA